jgi:transposase-like protein
MHNGFHQRPPTPHEQAICTQCGFTFERDQAWKRLCLSCWRLTRPQQQPELERMAAEVAQLRTQLAYARRVNDQLTQCVQRMSPRTLSLDVLKRLILLCHPDRHPARQAEATEITQILLQMRGER